MEGTTVRAEQAVVREVRIVEMEIASPWIRYWGSGEVEVGEEKEVATSGPPGREELSEGPYCARGQLSSDSARESTYLVVAVVPRTVVHRPVPIREVVSLNPRVPIVPTVRRSSSDQRSPPASKLASSKDESLGNDSRCSSAQRFRGGGAGRTSCEGRALAGERGRKGRRDGLEGIFRLEELEEEPEFDLEELKDEPLSASDPLLTPEEPLELLEEELELLLLLLLPELLLLDPRGDRL